MNNSKYYAVTTMCGHVGRNCYVEKTFPIMAANGKEAAEIGRWIPRVKHHNKHAILDVKEITENEFGELQEANNEDPYFFCKNKQEQKLYCDDLDIRALTTDEYDNTDHVHRSNFQCRKRKLDRDIFRDYLDELNYYEDFYGDEDYEN